MMVRRLSNSLRLQCLCGRGAAFSFPSFSLSLCDGCDSFVSVWADFIGMNVWAWVRFCGLRCFLSSRSLHIYRLYFIYTKRSSFFFSVCYKTALLYSPSFNIMLLLTCVCILHFFHFDILYGDVSLLLGSFIMHYRILICLWIIFWHFLSLLVREHAMAFCLVIISGSPPFRTLPHIFIPQRMNTKGKKENERDRQLDIKEGFLFFFSNQFNFLQMMFISWLINLKYPLDQVNSVT